MPGIKYQEVGASLRKGNKVIYDLTTKAQRTQSFS